MHVIKERKPRLSSALLFLLAAASGLIVANLYYSQTLIEPIALALGLKSSASGLIVTVTQLGYVAGLLLIVPLSDIVENRLLATGGLLLAAGALLAASLAPNASLFLTASLAVGLGSVTAQILVPFAAYLADAEERGRVVGNVMSGLLLGIMLARPVASLAAGYWGWQSVFGGSAAVMALLAVLLWRLLPVRRPQPSLKYGQLLASMATLIPQSPVLRRRALYQAALFGTFSLFWTTAPLYLAHHFGLNQQQIALFALVGVGGAAAAPVAGRLADRGLSRLATLIFIPSAALSMLMTVLAGHSSSRLALSLFFAAAISLDMAVSGNLVIGQRAIYSLGNEARGRLNGLFMAIFFLGGAAGSALGAWSYTSGGWPFAVWVGASLPAAAFLYSLTEKNANDVPDGRTAVDGGTADSRN